MNSTTRRLLAAGVLGFLLGVGVVMVAHVRVVYGMTGAFNQVATVETADRPQQFAAGIFDAIEASRPWLLIGGFLSAAGLLLIASSIVNHCCGSGSPPRQPDSLPVERG